MKSVLSLLVVGAICVASSVAMGAPADGDVTPDAAEDAPDAATVVDAATDTGFVDTPPLVPSNGDGHCTTSAPHGTHGGLSLLAIALAFTARRARASSR